MRPSESIMPTMLETNLESQFLRLAEEFSAHFIRLGLTLKVTRHSGPIEFRRASFLVQKRAIGYLEFNLSLVNEMVVSGESVSDSKIFLWRALKRLQLVPPADILDYINNDDIVELYYLDEIQAFRNFRFIELTSYSIEEMLCRPWYRNAGRALKPQMQLMAMVLRGKLGRIKQTLPWNVLQHELWEKDTECNYHFLIQLKHLIPLRSGGSVVAFVSTNSSIRI